MTKTKLVTLTPTDSFFFGGEQTFGNGDGRNFYAESRFFPQQTSIVGVLRHALFEAGQKDNFGKSFIVGKENDFGWLKSLSPVFLQHKTMGMGLPVHLPNNDDMVLETELAANTEVDFGFGFQSVRIQKAYTEKQGMGARILFSSGLKTYDDIFRKVIKTGIARDRMKHTNIEGMFYRQLLYRMKKDYSFGVYVTADERLFPILQRRNMPFGGEKVNFVLQVHEEGSFNPIHLRKRIPAQAIVLTSDAYISEQVYKHCSIAMTDTISFRNIVTPTDYTAALDQKDQKNGQRNRYKSGKFTLLKRGSILFPKGENEHQEIVKMLDNQQFTNIGYNHYFPNSKTT